MSALGEAAGDRAREEITSLLDGPDVTTRLKTLELIGSLNVAVAGPILGRRIQSDTFNDLSVEERKRWLETVTQLKASRGESLAVELLSKRRLLSSDASEQTRALAADHLAQFDSPETMEALQTASKQRWGTANAVREAATRAIAAIEARRAGKGKRPDAGPEAKP
jgi:hypothetical protein